MHKLSKAVVSQASPSKLASQAPWVDVHPDILDILKKDGVPVETMGEPITVNYTIPNPQDPTDKTDRIITRTETTQRILLAPLAEAYKTMVGANKVAQQAAAVKAAAEAANVQGGAKTRATAPV